MHAPPTVLVTAESRAGARSLPSSICCLAVGCWEVTWRGCFHPRLPFELKAETRLLQQAKPRIAKGATSGGWLSEKKRGDSRERGGSEEAPWVSCAASLSPKQRRRSIPLIARSMPNLQVGVADPSTMRRSY